MFRSFRYTFIIVLVSLGTALAAVGGWRYARASAPVAGPIILLSVDTLRADRLPVYGYNNVRTPAIDSLAADGVVFERAYSHAPQTLPSHASLLSGRLPFETGVRDNLGFAVSADERLLPQMLRERGFATGAVVSSYALREETGLGQGFEFFDAEMPPAADVAGGVAVERDGAASEAIAEQWLASQSSPRLFLFLHLYEPHKPYAPPARFSDLAPYDGEVAYTDEIVGRLLRYLKSHQLYDQSTIVLLSDHGEGLGDHGEQEHGLFVYEEAIRVPLIIKQAGNVRAGTRVPNLVQHVDLVPTLLDLAKAPVPDNLHGVSLTPLLDGTGDFPERRVYSESMYARYHFGWSGLMSLTDGRYRYVSAPRPELYDLERDPGQRENVADAHRATLEALASALDEMTGGAGVHAPAEVRADVRERLQALGYVGTPNDVTTPGGPLADPKDKIAILETYRGAIEADGRRDWNEATALLRLILEDDAGMIDVWDQLAAISMRAGRYDQALEAYGRIVELDPGRTTAYLGAARALLRVRRLTDARAQAELGLGMTPDRDAIGIAAAHTLLARIALARRDVDAAREAARRAHAAVPKLPMPLYVDARLLYDQGRYAEALPLFQRAIAAVGDDRDLQIGELHFEAAETLARLGRPSEAERAYGEELKHFPLNARAHAARAALYHATDRPEAAALGVDSMLRAIPNAETYALGARLWTSFGNRQQAETVRAEARRMFGPGPAERGTPLAQD